MLPNFFHHADDEVLVIKSVTHRDFNKMIDVSNFMQTYFTLWLCWLQVYNKPAIFVY